MANNLSSKRRSIYKIVLLQPKNNDKILKCEGEGMGKFTNKEKWQYRLVVAVIFFAVVGFVSVITEFVKVVINAVKIIIN